MRILILYLFVIISSNLFGQLDTNRIEFFITNKIDSMPNGFAISIALIKENEVIYIGFTKENNKITAKKLRDSLFEIGSITKVFTASLLAEKVVSKELNLSDKINKSFPYKLNNQIKLKYRNLANHTSGLYRIPSNILPLLIKNQKNPYSEYSKELFDQYLRNDLVLEQTKKPKYSYSNLGFGLLAYALSQNSNKTFEELLRTSVFSKYKMSNTSFQNRTSFSGIGLDGNQNSIWDFNALKGAGGLISNTSDLSKFIIEQFDENNCSLYLTKKITHSISDKMSIGLGWHILNPNDENLKYWHNGGTGGSTSSIAFRTNNKTGVIVLTNISALHKQALIVDELCFDLLELLK